MKIDIVKNEGNNDWSISFGDLICEHLLFDEALGVVASLLLGVKPRYAQTMQQWYMTEFRYGSIEPATLFLTDKRVIAGHVIQAETHRRPIREVSRQESARIKNKTFPNL